MALYPGQDPRARRRRRLIVAAAVVVVVAGGVVAGVLLTRDTGKPITGHPGGEPATVAAVMHRCGADNPAPVEKIDVAAVEACLFGHILKARVTPSQHALVGPLENAAGVKDRPPFRGMWPVVGDTVTLLGYRPGPRGVARPRPHANSIGLSVAWKDEAADGSVRWCITYGPTGAYESATSVDRTWGYYLDPDSNWGPCRGAPYPGAPPSDQWPEVPQ